MKDPIAKPVGADELQQVIDRAEFGRAVRKGQQRDVFRNGRQPLGRAATSLLRALEVLDVTGRDIEQGETAGIASRDKILTAEPKLCDKRRVNTATLVARLTTIKTRNQFVFQLANSSDFIEMVCQARK